MFQEIVDRSITANPIAPDDPFKLETFAAWINQQSGPYSRRDVTNCPLARYFTACGFRDVRLVAHEDCFTHADGEASFRSEFDNVIFNWPHTYEAAQARVRDCRPW